ncbi:hypothetical protein DYU11_20920 [Fibrisoma montanum]|uniref:Uncharacterized protein n=1 Tax=Fibrisoma montanum TaxID=2305895 RepID=A0A418M449_9BACT|nr:hypothetical protein [Fibrisoma montanum]RIV20510.1 hypothetical protein DYU11_20920 [Fibrisoma montanum]
MAKPVSYQELSINEKINLKGLILAWNDIAIQRWQGELDDKVYRSVQRKYRNRFRDARGKYAKSSNNSYGRTMRLRSDWQSRVYAEKGGGISGLRISFLLYGRFVDMGVGNGIDYAESKYRRVRANGEPTQRRPKRWYSRRKGYETYRLRELLSKYYVNVTLDALEQVLTDSVTVRV